jgi:CRISPR-associated protein Csm2
MDIFRFDTNASPPVCHCNGSLFNLCSPTVELFDRVSRSLAEQISNGQMLVQREEYDERERRRIKVWRVVQNKDANKPAQIRKFYDELCMWAEKTQSADDLQKNLPFIKMMNAKVAYARGRDLVDDKFMSWFSCCMAQMKAADDAGLAALQTFRTLFEAFLGFYKLARPK